MIVTHLARLAREYVDGRELLWQLVARELRVRYHQAALGLAWAVLLPALFVGGAALLRPALAGGAPGGTGALDTAIRGVLWTGFSAAVATGTSSLVANAALVGKVAFVREMLPLSAVLAAGVDLTVGVGVVIVWRALAVGALTWSVLWIVPLVLVLLLAAAALALLLSAAQLFFRDIKFAVQAALTAGVFVTPVLFGVNELGRAGHWMQWNPLTPLLEGARIAVIGGESLTQRGAGGGWWEPSALLATTLGAALLFGIAALVFDHLEDRFAERL